MQKKKKKKKKKNHDIQLKNVMQMIGFVIKRGGGGGEWKENRKTKKGKTKNNERKNCYAEVVLCERYA